MQQKYQYDRVLSGELHPFPGIYEAVSEQILLLILKHVNYIRIQNIAPGLKNSTEYSLHYVPIQSS
ncbi:hypothetical protein DMI60_16730 [Escherichia coli]|nr:hypothetical protein [Escherichia coli]